MADDPKSLDEALAILQADPPILTKNRSGQVGNQRTRYADLVQVNAVVLSRLNALGVVYKTKPTLRAEDPKFVLAYELKHVASGTSETGEYPLKLSDNPQAMGSATTYARRYVLLAITGIAAEDEDDDGQAASGRYAQRAAQPRQRGEQPTAQRRTRSGPAGGPPLPGEDPAKRQRDRMFALLRDADLSDRDAALRYISDALGRPVESTKDLTDAEVGTVVERLVAYVAQSEPETTTPGGEGR